MFIPSNRNKSCGLCALALAVSVGLFTLSAPGADRTPAESSPSALADAKERPTANPHHQKQVDTLVKVYLDVQNLLSQDKLEGVLPQLAKIRESAKSVSESEDAKLAAQAKTVAKHATGEPKTLEAARDAFKPLSAAVIGLVKIVPPTTEAAPALYEATCPMVKANWLQTTKDVANPYMGKAMLECGSIERTVKAPAAGERTTSEAQTGSRGASASAGMACCAGRAG